MRLIAPAAAVAAALLLAGCGDDDEGGPGPGGLQDPGEFPELELPDLDSGALELDTTGGAGDEGAPDLGEGDASWYAQWEADGITLYTTTDGVLYGNSGTGEVCTQDAGIAGALDWEPVLFSCEGGAGGFGNATLRLSGDTMAIEWSDRTEEVTRVESLAGQSVDLAALEAGILN